LERYGKKQIQAAVQLGSLCGVVRNCVRGLKTEPIVPANDGNGQKGINKTTVFFN
jgi:hypothetical protein